jgi:uncharacterized protein DUF6644
MSILQMCEWIANTSTSVGIRESTWTYPIIESVHVLGLTLFLGLLLLWDTRLLGFVLRRVPVSALWRQLFPWIAFGAIIVTISGSLLFWSDPVKFYGNIFFRIKVLALLLAAGNAAAYHLGIERRLVEWDTAAPPRAAKIAGATSIAVWAIVVVVGRLIAYNWFAPLA